MRESTTWQYINFDVGIMRWSKGLSQLNYIRKTNCLKFTFDKMWWTAHGVHDMLCLI